MALVDGKADFLAAAQLQLEALFPGTLTVDGVDYAVARSAMAYEEEGETGGYDPGGVTHVRLRTELVEQRLAHDLVVELDGRPMRVGDVHMEPGDVAWLVELLEP